MTLLRNIFLIYPDCLNLKKSNEHDLRVDVLDISVTIHNNSLHLNLYDKRKDFNFTVFSMPHWYNNLRKNFFLSIF